MEILLTFQEEYLVKWDGEPESNSTWISSKDLLYKDAIKAFENSLLAHFQPETVSDGVNSIRLNCSAVQCSCIA